MARRGKPEERPDALVYVNEGRRWAVFCTLCPRELRGTRATSWEAQSLATEHLRYSHGLLRVYVDRDTPEHRRAVQEALPLVVAHDRTLATDRWQG